MKEWNISNSLFFFFFYGILIFHTTKWIIRKSFPIQRININKNRIKNFYYPKKKKKKKKLICFCLIIEAIKAH